jgi:broad specificity phosphatase PhoE
MSRGIILLRHALPELVRGVSSTLWGLSESAREDCVLLSEHLPCDIGGAVFSSSERKAKETAAVIALRRGLNVLEDEGLGEVDRPTTWDDDYRSIAEGYLRGDSPADWEPRERVIERFAAAVGRAMTASSSGDIVVANHGMALALYLARTSPVIIARDGAAGLFDLVPFWRALTFPDAWRFDPVANTVERIFDAGLPPPDA